MPYVTHAWLHATALGRPHGVSYTVYPPRGDAYAHISISTFVPAEHTSAIGTGAHIVAYTSIGRWEGGEFPKFTFLPPDFKYNALYIPDCTSVTFALMVKNAWAYAAGVVHTF
jgi:hypothetical protein